MERELVRRAVSDPKPLYYNEKFLDQKLAEYVDEAELEGPTKPCPTSSCAGSFRRSSPIAGRSTKRWRSATATR